MFYRNEHSMSISPISRMAIIVYLATQQNDKIVVLKKTTLQLYFKTLINKINSANLIMS